MRYKSGAIIRCKANVRWVDDLENSSRYGYGSALSPHRLLRRLRCTSGAGLLQRASQLAVLLRRGHRVGYKPRGSVLGGYNKILLPYRLGIYAEKALRPERELDANQVASGHHHIRYHWDRSARIRVHHRPGSRDNRNDRLSCSSASLSRSSVFRSPPAYHYGAEPRVRTQGTGVFRGVEGRWEQARAA